MHDYTYYSPQHDTFTRIDYILISTSLLKCVKSPDIGLCTLSDHAWTSCILSDFLQDTQSHSHTWSLNKTLLFNPDFCSIVESDLKEYFQINSTDDVSSSTVWDAMKAVLWVHFIALGSAFKKCKTQLQHELLHLISSLESQHKQTGSKKLYQKLLLERKKLETLDTTQAQKSLLFTKQTYWFKHPRSLEVISWKLSKNLADRHIHFIKDSVGNSHYTSSDILKVFEAFYKNLYKSDSPNPVLISSYLRLNRLTNPITDSHKEFLDQPILAQEMITAIKSAKLNKAPGPDSFSSEFYKKFAPLLIPHLVTVCNDILDYGQLPSSWETVKITVIPTKDKDPSNPKSYRPISLLNTDHELFTSVLTSRLNTLIHHYIHINQTNFIPGREISDNTRKTLDLIQHCKQLKLQDTCLLSLDVEKAFNRVEPLFLQEVQSDMNFGVTFCILSTPVLRLFFQLTVFPFLLFPLSWHSARMSPFPPAVCPSY